MERREKDEFKKSQLEGKTETEIEWIRKKQKILTKKKKTMS